MVVQWLRRRAFNQARSYTDRGLSVQSMSRNNNNIIIIIIIIYFTPKCHEGRFAGVEVRSSLKFLTPPLSQILNL